MLVMFLTLRFIFSVSKYLGELYFILGLGALKMLQWLYLHITICHIKVSKGYWLARGNA